MDKFERVERLIRAVFHLIELNYGKSPKNDEMLQALLDAIKIVLSEGE